jgi:hypothetical protein
LHSYFVWFNDSYSFIWSSFRVTLSGSRSEDLSTIQSRKCQTLGVPQQSWGFSGLINIYDKRIFKCLKLRQFSNSKTTKPF